MRLTWSRSVDHTTGRRRRQLWIAAVAVTIAVVGAIGGRPSTSLPRAGTDTPWTQQMRATDRALAEGDAGAALRALDQARAAARARRRWEDMIEVGDRYLQIGKVSGAPSGSTPKAREMYLLAFFGARSQGAADGMLRAAEGFRALGDTEPALLMTRAADAAAPVISRHAPEPSWRSPIHGSRGRPTMTGG